MMISRRLLFQAIAALPLIGRRSAQAKPNPKPTKTVVGFELSNIAVGKDVAPHRSLEKDYEVRHIKAAGSKISAFDCEIFSNGRKVARVSLPAASDLERLVPLRTPVLLKAGDILTVDIIRSDSSYNWRRRRPVLIVLEGEEIQA